MNIRKRVRLAAPVSVVPGDTISVIYREQGKVDVVFVKDTFTTAYTFDEAAIIDGKLEEDGRLYVGGILIEQIK